MKICKTCKKELQGRKRIYCDTSCKNKFYYDKNIKGSPQEHYDAHIKMAFLRSSCIKRGISPPTISKLKVIELLSSDVCHYCRNTGSMTIDRKDSFDTYTDYNCVPCCKRCNHIKSNILSYDEMIKFVEFIGWR